MKYEIFTDAESLLSKRLREMPGDEDLTLKEAGFNHVWTHFVEGFLNEGWDAARRADLLTKTASDDPFSEGESEALDTIQAIYHDEFSRGWFSSLKLAHDHVCRGGTVDEFCKEAMDTPIEGSEKEIEGFLAGCEDMLESDSDLIKMAWKGPNHQENEPMNNFELGKIAAYNDLVGLAEEGASLQDCIELVGETLATDLEKFASEEDVAYRAGVENVCYAFMKSASDVFDGSYDLSSVDDSDVLEHVLVDIHPEGEGVEKTASYNDVIEFLSGLDSATFDKVAEVVLDQFDAEELEKIAMRKQDKVIMEHLRKGRFDKVQQIAKGLERGHGKGHMGGGFRQMDAKAQKLRGAGAPPDLTKTEKLRDGANLLGRKLRDSKYNNKYTRGAAIGAGIAGLGAGAYALGRRGKDEGQQKAASLNDSRVNEALSVLAEAGLLDD